MNHLPGLGEIGARTFLARLDPRLKLVYLLWVSTLSVLLDSTWALVALAGVSFGVACGLVMPVRSAARLLLLLALVAWSTMLSQGLFYQQLPRTELLRLFPASQWWGWKLGGLALYREGLVYGLTQSLRLVAVSLSGLAVCWSTSPERLLSALLRLKTPVAVAFLTVTALRFLPLLASEWGLVRQARRLRTRQVPLPWWRQPWRIGHRLADEVDLLLPLLSAALRRATCLATSVAARGFDPQAPRTTYPPLIWRSHELLLLGLLLWSLALLATMKVLYWLYVDDWYYAPALRGLYDLTRRWL